MLGQSTIYIAAVFALAGLVKGVIGLGLPTISMGLLVFIMPPVEAAAILVAPSLLTNVWQMLAGGSLRSIARRLWPMMAAICIGTWLGSGLMSGGYACYGVVALGVALALYALTGIVVLRLAVPRRSELALGPLTGLVTGIITAATGVFVIPAVPYLQAIGFEKDELVQALGLSFTISTIALGFSVGASGALTLSLAVPVGVAVVLSIAGMGAGQALRSRLSPAKFRQWFFIALLLLGIYLALAPLI